MNLELTVQDQFQKLIDCGKVEEIIGKHLESTIADIIKSSLNTYSDFGKSLQEVIKTAMKIDVSKIGTLGYQQIVVDTVNRVLEQNLLTQLQEPMVRILTDVLTPFEHRPYKLSEIVEVFMEQEREEDLGYSMTLIIEANQYGTTRVYMDKKEDQDSHKCEYRFNVHQNDGKIWMFESKGYNPVQTDLTKRAVLGTFDKMLFNLYASQCPIVIDEQDCETEWNNDDY